MSKKRPTKPSAPAEGDALCYNVPLINWRSKKLKKTLRDFSVAPSLMMKIFAGTANPTAQTIEKLASDLGLHRKFLIDPDLKRRDFHRAVVVNGGKR